MTQIDTYKHLNEDSMVEIVLPIEPLAKQICELNYGAHRLLSAMVHELRAVNTKFVMRQVEAYEKRGDVYPLEDRNSPLADGIEKLLNSGLYY